MSLSSTSNIEAFIVIVSPWTVKSPLITTSPPIFKLLFAETVTSPVIEVFPVTVKAWNVDSPAATVPEIVVAPVTVKPPLAVKLPFNVPAVVAPIVVKAAVDDAVAPPLAVSVPVKAPFKVEAVVAPIVVNLDNPDA